MWCNGKVLWPSLAWPWVYDDALEPWDPAWRPRFSIDIYINTRGEANEDRASSVVSRSPHGSSSVGAVRPPKEDIKIRMYIYIYIYKYWLGRPTASGCCVMDTFVNKDKCVRAFTIADIWDIFFLFI